MTKILAVLLWPAGIAVIVAAGALLAMRARQAIPGRPPARGPSRYSGHRPQLG